MGQKKTKMFKNCWVLDFETTTNKTKWYQDMLDKTGKEWVRPTYWSMCSYDGSKWLEGVSWEDFATTLTTNENFRKDTTIWLHNLKFDGAIINYILEEILKFKHVFHEIEIIDDKTTINRVGYKTIKNKNCNPQVELETNYFDSFQQKRKIYSINTRFTPKGVVGSMNPIRVNFRCSLAMLSSSVKKLGDSYKNVIFEGKPLIKMSKEEKAQGENFYHVEPIDDLNEFKKKNPDYVAYCRRDVEIVRRSLIDFDAMINELEAIQEHKQINNIKHYSAYKQPITVASLGRKIIKDVYVPKFQRENINRFGKHVEIIDGMFVGDLSKMNKESWDFFNSPSPYHDLFEEYKNNTPSTWYRGGYNEFSPQIESFKDIENCNGAIKIDVSSAYPYQMTKSLPFGPILDSQEFEKVKVSFDKRGILNKNDWIEGRDYIEWKEVFVNKAIPKEIAKYCPTLKNFTHIKDKRGNEKRYCDETQEKFIFRVSKIEWDELQNWYEFEVDELMSTNYYQLAASYLKECANSLYMKKDYYSSQGLEAKKLGTKILMNSIYGSLAIKDGYDSYCRIKKEDEDKFKNICKSDDWLNCEGRKESQVKVKNITSIIESSNNIGVILDFNNDIKTFNSEWCEFELPSQQTSWNISASAYITSLERVYLFEVIRTFGAKHFAYSDTDSIIFYNIGNVDSNGNKSEIRKRIEHFCENYKPNRKQNLSIVDYFNGVDCGEVINNLGCFEIEVRFIDGFNSYKAKQYLTRKVCFDEKKKQFYKYKKDIHGKIMFDENDKPIKEYCSYEEADREVSIKAGGLDNENEKLELILSLTQKQYQTMSNEELCKHFNQQFNIDEILNMRNGEHEIIDGGNGIKFVNGGPLIIKTTKKIRYGAI